MDLVILAAGSGTRYGGLKQFEQFGPQGQCLYYYSVYDALAAGFNRMIFVVREDTDREAIERSLSDFKGNIAIEFVNQRLELPQSIKAAHPDVQRSKPWGTTNALIQAAPKIKTMFAIVNSDDFYGAEAFTAMAEYLKFQTNNTKAAAVVGYQLGHTLSKHGRVNRGICNVDDNGSLKTINETLQIVYGEDGRIESSNADEHTVLADNTTVSMNFWGFHPTLLDKFALNFARFTKTINDYQKDELCLSTTVDHLIRTDAIDVKVLPTTAAWFGITYPEDRESVCQHLAGLSKSGRYTTQPGPLITALLP